MLFVGIYSGRASLKYKSIFHIFIIKGFDSFFFLREGGGFGNSCIGQF